MVDLIYTALSVRTGILLRREGGSILADHSWMVKEKCSSLAIVRCLLDEFFIFGSRGVYDYDS